MKTFLLKVGLGTWALFVPMHLKADPVAPCNQSLANIFVSLDSTSDHQRAYKEVLSELVRKLDVDSLKAMVLDIEKDLLFPLPPEGTMLNIQTAKALETLYYPAHEEFGKNGAGELNKEVILKVAHEKGAVAKKRKAVRKARKKVYEPHQIIQESSYTAASIAFSTDGKWVAVGRWGPIVQITNLETLKTFEFDSGADKKKRYMADHVGRNLAFLPAKNRLLMTKEDELWTLEFRDGQWEWVVKENFLNLIQQIDVSPSGKVYALTFLVSHPSRGSASETITYDSETDKRLNFTSVETHTRNPTLLFDKNDNLHWASPGGHPKFNVSLFSELDSSEVQWTDHSKTISTTTGSSNARVWLKDRGIFVTGTQGGMVYKIDLTRSNRPTLLAILKNPVSGMDLSPDGKVLAVAADHTEVSLVNTKTWKEIARIKPKNTSSSTMQNLDNIKFSPDNKHLVLTDPERTHLFTHDGSWAETFGE